MPTPDWLRRTALRAAAQGFYVFPVERGGKTPAVEKGTSWDEVASRDHDQINVWWERTAHNIGISTGRSGLLVIDLDQARGAQASAEWPDADGGREVLYGLASAAGEPYPDHTLTITAPSVIKGASGRALRCLRRLIMTVSGLLASVLSAGVPQRSAMVACPVGGVS